jgi:hypothetical protein
VEDECGDKTDGRNQKEIAVIQFEQVRVVVCSVVAIFAIFFGILILAYGLYLDGVMCILLGLILALIVGDRRRRKKK